MELDWFWHDWVFTAARLDQAVDSVTVDTSGRASVHLFNRGTMVMPVELRLTYTDRSTDTVKLPVEMWNLGQRFVYRVPATKRVRRVEVDPRAVLPDVDRTNNRWEKR